LLQQENDPAATGNVHYYVDYNFCKGKSSGNYKLQKPFLKLKYTTGF
jgi:hypothetical protein